MNPTGPRLLPALALISLALSCSDPAPPVVDASVDLGAADVARLDDPALVLGTGQSAWEDLPDGARVELIHGPQGGYHVFARLRERLAGGDVQVTFRVTPEEGGAAVNDPADRIRLLEGRGLFRSGDRWESSSALLVILATVRAPAEVVGRRFVLELNVAPTASSTVFSTRRTITIVDET